MRDCPEPGCGHSWHPAECPNCESQLDGAGRCATCGDKLSADRRRRVLEDMCPWCGAESTGRTLEEELGMPDGEAVPEFPTDLGLYLEARRGLEPAPLPGEAKPGRSSLALVYSAFVTLARPDGPVPWVELRAFFEGVGLGWVGDEHAGERGRWHELFGVLAAASTKEERRRAPGREETED